MINEDFKDELSKLINKYSVENEINMPDYMLADMICDLISNVGARIKQRDAWMGYTKDPVGSIELVNVELQVESPSFSHDDIPF